MYKWISQSPWIYGASLKAADKLEGQNPQINALEAELAKNNNGNTDLNVKNSLSDQEIALRHRMQVEKFLNAERAAQAKTLPRITPLAQQQHDAEEVQGHTLPSISQQPDMRIKAAPLQSRYSGAGSSALNHMYEHPDMYKTIQEVNLPTISSKQQTPQQSHAHPPIQQPSQSSSIPMSPPPLQTPPISWQQPPSPHTLQPAHMNLLLSSSQSQQQPNGLSGWALQTQYTHHQPQQQPLYTYQPQPQIQQPPQPVPLQISSLQSYPSPQIIYPASGPHTSLPPSYQSIGGKVPPYYTHHPLVQAQRSHAVPPYASLSPQPAHFQNVSMGPTYAFPAAAAQIQRGSVGSSYSFPTSIPQNIQIYSPPPPPYANGLYSQQIRFRS